MSEPFKCTECGVELSFPEGKFWAFRDLAPFCPPCLATEDSAKLVKLDGSLQECSTCGVGIGREMIAGQCASCFYRKDRR